MPVFARWTSAPLVLLALLSPALATNAWAQSTNDGLSLAEAVALAEQNNPTYLTQRNQLASAEWAVRSAYGSLVPQLNLSNSFGYTAKGERRFDSVVLDQQPEIYSSRYSLGASLQLNGSTLLAPRVAKAQERAAEQEVRGAAANLEAEVAQRYLAVLQAREAVDQAEREVARTEEHLRLAEARLQVGTGIQLDVSRARVEQGQAQVRLLQARNQAENDLLLLSQSIGTRLPEEVELTERFELFDPTWSLAQLVGIANEQNPVVQASRAQANAARTLARAARSAYLPTIQLSAGLSGYVSEAGSLDPLVSQALQQAGSAYGQCVDQNQIRQAVGLTPNTCVNPALPSVEGAIRDQVAAQNRGFPFDYITQPASASLTISLPVFTGLQRQRQIEEARISRLNADYQVRLQELQLEVQVETSLRDLETAYQTALLQQQIRETAEEELSLAQERFRLGLATSIEVVDAQASLAEAERAEIAAVYDFHRALATLEANLGTELPR